MIFNILMLHLKFVFMLERKCYAESNTEAWLSSFLPGSKESLIQDVFDGRLCQSFSNYISILSSFINNYIKVPSLEKDGWVFLGPRKIFDH